MRVIAAALTVSCLVVAPALAAPVLYGEVHLSINKIDRPSSDEVRMDSHYSSIGLKGSEDLDHGVKLIYKAEFSYDTTEQNSGAEDGASLSDRDQWLGFASHDWGVVRMGMVSTSYKSSGAALDPLYNTAFEQRGYMGMQSALHAGNGVDGGRSTNTIRIDSIAYQGAKLVASYSLGEDKENTTGLGIHYKQDSLKLNFDYLDSQSKNATALKFGIGYAVTPQFALSFQHERADSELFDAGVDVASLGAIDTVYKADMSYITGNSAWVLAYGAQSGYNKSYLLVWNHKLSPKTDVYTGYGRKGFDRRGVESGSIFAFGLRHKF
ncbi:hypothetical protein MNBD_GAMMA18-246 [hydrothermal vent metagenome]|uniref:Porin domain-containing protein n=1 Tax=hydrothermal vent metagenome TaxID=652676 RepID=A0A3B0YT81_9ZZZZ